jgi:hypothetical protein
MHFFISHSVLVFVGPRKADPATPQAITVLLAYINIVPMTLV